MLSNTSGGLIAGLGVFLLLYTVVKVLGNIEKSFNDIWGIKKGRSLGRRLSDYLSIMLICPVLFIMSSSFTVLIASQIKTIVEKISFLGAVGPLIFAGLKLLPFAVFWLLFCFIYIFMPNTKVRLRSGIIAGVMAGTVYEVLQWAYINFQVGVAKYNAIYGSFAALPLFLVWLQLSWLVVLLGAEISFAHQNVDTYEFEPDCLRISYAFKRLLSLKVMHRVVKNFIKGLEPMSATELSHVLDIPIRLVRQILFDLAEAGLVSEICAKEEAGYQPGCDVSELSVGSVCSALEKKGVDAIPVKHSPEFDSLVQSLDAFARAVEKSPANKKLKDI